MSRLKGTLKEAAGRLTGDLVLEYEGRMERHGRPFTHIDSVGERVEAVLQHRIDDDVSGARDEAPLQDASDLDSVLQDPELPGSHGPWGGRTLH